MDNSIRADVRTIWMREGRYGTSNVEAGDYLVTSDCVKSNPAALDLSSSDKVLNIGAVYSSTVLRWFQL